MTLFPTNEIANVVGEQEESKKWEKEWEGKSHISADRIGSVKKFFDSILTF